MRTNLTLLGQILANRVLQVAEGDAGGGAAPALDPTAAFQRLLDKNNNDGVKLAATLFDENFQYRETIRKLKEAQPGTGALVLSADDAKEYGKLRTVLGDLDSKGLKEILEKYPDLEKSNKELASMENIRELADVGIDGSKLKVSVLKDLVLSKYPEAEFRFVTEKDKDGNDVRTAHIKPTKDGTESTFADFAAQNLSDYLPALKVTAEQMQAPTGATPDPAPTGGNANFFDRIREQVTKENEVAAAQQNTNPLARFGRAESAQ
jgi:hypothetical protein